MTFTREQRQSAYKKLSQEVQDFVMSNETTDFITATLNEAGLSGEQADQADSEILYALYGLQTLDTAITNIAKASGKNLSVLKRKLEENIFSKIPKGSVDQAKSKTSAIHNDLPVVEEGEKVHDVPHDTKLDVMPARTTVQSGGPKPVAALEPKVVQPAPAPAPQSASAETVPPTPSKLRPSSDNSANTKKNDLKTPDYRYPGGADPYREPLA